MLFNSFEFLLFFIIVTTLYFSLPHKLRWLVLLIASCIFYMAFVPAYIIILFATIVIDYIAGIMIERAGDKNKKSFLILSLIANIGVLAVFKYYNFFVENINAFLDLTSSRTNVPYMDILLPIGLSFHTFQAMSYTIEVYRGNQKAERHFGIYALYVMFYPQLVAGPIERPQNMLHQFHEKHKFEINNFEQGIKLMLWGIFKKVVIADRLAIVVNTIYKNAEHATGVSLLIAAVFFTFQIYCDFSGYSDIALGSAQVMGFKLMVNFDRPFASRSVTEFWRRWHISLATWFNDYLFNPLVFALRRHGKMAIVAGLLVTFFLSGFWHGAGWKFIIYGVLNGLALVYEFYTKKKRKKIFGRLPKSINDLISRILTVGFITFSWIFFRAQNIDQALYIIGHLGTGWSNLCSVSGLKLILRETGGNDMFMGIVYMISSILLIVFMEMMQNIAKDRSVPEYMEKKPEIGNWAFYYALIICILVFGAFENQEFIYFQF